MNSALKADIAIYEELFKYMVKQLSLGKDENRVNTVILERVCDLFLMDTAFIYLKDLSRGKGLSLHMQIKNSETLLLPEKIFVENIFSQSELQMLNEQEHLDEQLLNNTDSILASAFSAAQIVSLPIIDKDQLVGVIGTLTTKKSEFSSLSMANKKIVRLILAVTIKSIKLCSYSQQLDFAKQSLERTIDNIGVDIYVVDFHTYEILYANKSMAAPYGGVDKLIGQKCYLALYKDKTEKCEYCPKDKIIDEEGNPSKIYSWDYQRPFDGSWFRVFSAAFSWFGGRLAHVISSVDITENKQNESLVKKMAYFDNLTGIPNRRSLEEDFVNTVDHSLLTNKLGYLAFVDLDNFKLINDAFGHAKGDELLKQVAVYLSSFPSSSFKAYRFGGDEFILLFENSVNQEEVIAITDKLMQRFKEPWTLGEIECFCTASIGIACFPDDGISIDELLHSADSAMYEVKKHGKSSVAFSKGRYIDQHGNLEKEFALRRAIADGCKEFHLLFHPMAEAKTGLWVGAEVLTRWNSPKFGSVLPEDFIPICERLGLISQLGNWIISTALKESKSWKIDFQRQFFISFNISVRQIQDDGFNEYLLDLLRELDYPCSDIMLELTGSLPISNIKRIKSQIDFLRNQGVRVALDSFGTGHTRLDTILSLTVDLIKIDRQFIMNFLDDNLKVALVGAITMLSHAACTKVCAGGVISQEHKAVLIDIGCDFLQGTYFQQPLSGAELKKALLENWQ